MQDALWHTAPLALLALAPSLVLAWAAFSHMHSFRCAPSLPRGCGFARRLAIGFAVALVAAPASAFALLCTPPALVPAACDDALLIAARTVAATGERAKMMTVTFHAKRILLTIRLAPPNIFDTQSG